MNGLLCG